MLSERKQYLLRSKMQKPKHTLIIGSPNYSSWSLRAYLALAWSGLDFTTIKYDFDDNFSANIAPYSKVKQVPILLVEDFAISDSLAIAEYLAETSSVALWPESWQHRHQARSAVAQMHSGFRSLRRHLPMNMRKSFGADSWLKLVPQSMLQDELDLLTDLLKPLLAQGGPWLNGAHPGIADAFFAPVASRLRSYGVATSLELQPWLQAILAQPDVEAWRQMGVNDPIVAEDEVQFPN